MKDLRGDKELHRSVKTIADPRKVDYIFTSHYMVYFDNLFAIDENTLKFFPNIDYKLADKIVINHYQYKSTEEFARKNPRGSAAYGKNKNHESDNFSHKVFNDVEDDSILKYRAALISKGGGIIRAVNYQKSYTALLQNLSPTFHQSISQDFFKGKMETFLTCRKLVNHMQDKLFEKDSGKFFEETALKAVYRTLFTNISTTDFKLLLSELPNILSLNYPVVKNIVEVSIHFLERLRDIVRESIDSPQKMMLWRDFIEYDYKLRILQNFVTQKN